MEGPEATTQAAAGAFPLRRFAATHISRAIDEQLRDGGGTVEGIHRSAMNIRWRRGMLTLAHGSVGGLPNGILIKPEIPLDRIGLALGMRVVADGFAVRIPGASTAIFLSGAARWSPVLLPVPGSTVEERTDRADRALGVAAGLAPQLGLGPLLRGLVDPGANVGSLGRAAAWALADVIDALAAGDAGNAVVAADRLVGLGPGATPSGDDLLVGFAAGLAATGHPDAELFASGVARRAVGLTTSVAECYLLHAGRLEFSERVHTAAHVVLAGPEAELHRVVTTAMSWGASSGADLLVGLLVGMQATGPGIVDRLRACAREGHAAA
jgi:uncharacterized protein DUF2877